MKYKVLIFGLMALALSCQPKTEYDKLKERELASGRVVEDLFLDLRFGMGRKEFFATCWEHNKNGILTNGAHYLQIEYKPEVPSGKSVRMNFYPQFDDNHLYFMPMEFQYDSWFPGNENFTNDKLLVDVLGLLKEWYGEDFLEVSNKSKTVKAFVRIDGNRWIRVFIKDMTTVRVEMLDLRIKDIADMTNNRDEA
ncbi:hypothetical protein [Cecembia sp.]|uniref:hypothetical protein n=1 Tax=Cecembia sp. TaxID=1898110 RepID=UPI0025BF945A|nr:hypothetical protein [Cecembia sp.]